MRKTLLTILFAVAALASCDAAWDGPSFMEQGFSAHNPSPDSFADAYAGQDIEELEDVVSVEDTERLDLASEDLSEPDTADISDPTPDIYHPDIPQILGCEAPEGMLNPLAEMHLSDEATPGWGIDLDGNLDTCNPEKLGCDHGIDNSLAAIASLLDPIVQAVVRDGAGPAFAMQHLTENSEAAPYDLAIWSVTAEEGDECHSAETCTLSLHSQTHEGACEPAWILNDARVFEGEVLVAGRYDTKHTFRMALGGEDNYKEIDLYALQIRALVTWDEDRIVGLSGVLGGAIRFSDLLNLLGLVPDNFWTPDVDYDYLVDYLNFLEFVSGSPLTDFFIPDGSGYAASFALTFEAFEADAVSGDTTQTTFHLAR